MIDKIKIIARTTLDADYSIEEIGEKLALIDPEKMVSIEERRRFKELMHDINLSHLKI